MNIYDEFHGKIPVSQIGKRLREITKVEKGAYKIITGYGSTSARASSKFAALSSLRKMEQEGLIAGYLPGEVRNEAIKSNSAYFDFKLKYESQISKDSDYGNDGVIFIFMK